MNIVSPSILSADFLKLEDEIKAFNDCEDLWFHLDVMDGHYVPNLSFGHTVLKGIQKVTKHKLDAHLMVTNPEDYVEVYKDLGLHNLTFHWEACKDHRSLISEIKKSYPSVGVSLNPATPLSVIPEELYKEIDLLLVMSVNPGFGGQSFIEETYDKVKEASEIRSKTDSQFLIQVDGGISDKNAKALREVGADLLVAGSYIFKDGKDKYKERVESLR